MTYDHKQGSKVHYIVAGYSGIGRVCGVATTPVPVIGVTYIIEDMSGNFPNETYPYTHFPCFSLHIHVADE